MTRVATRAAIAAGLAAYGPLIGSGAGGTWPEAIGPQIRAWRDAQGIEASCIIITSGSGSLELRSIVTGSQTYRDTHTFTIIGLTAPRAYAEAMTLGQSMLTGIVGWCAANPDVNNVESLIIVGADGPEPEPAADGQGVVTVVSVEVEVVEWIN